MAKWIEAKFDGFDISVNTVRRLASSLLIEAGIDKVAVNTSDYWDNVCVRAVDDALPSMKQNWDAIIIDEGQDFSDGEWCFVDELNKTSEHLWIFYDQKQAFWKDRGVPNLGDGFFKFNLTNNYRCPEPITNLAEGYLGESINLKKIKQAQSEGTIGVISCPSISSIKSKVEVEINKLLSEGLSPSDIAVLSLRGKETILDYKTIGKHETIFCDDMGTASKIIADSFLRFKGLERPAIIIVGLELVKNSAGNRMYIALTRALTAVRVVSDKETIANDTNLSFLI